jgi:RHS repeat-associated protein
MAMSVVYTTVNGQVLSENRGGVVHHFIPDPLGSVVMVRDSSGNTVYTAEYAPYGDVQSETGTNPSEFGYVGALGYVMDSASSLYVRARYLLTNLGRWLTKDPLWPREPGYVYAGAMPNLQSDPSGYLWWVIIVAGYGAACVHCLLRTLDAISKAGLPKKQDKRKHCLFACMVTMTCHVPCGLAFAIGTEIFDLGIAIFGGGGDLDWTDYNANFAGVACGSMMLPLTGCVPWWFFNPLGWCEFCCSMTNYGGVGPGGPNPTSG